MLKKKKLRTLQILVFMCVELLHLRALKSPRHNQYLNFAEK